MSKLIVGFIWVVLAFQAQGQTVIKRCADGSTVGGNSSCPSRSLGNSAPVYKNWDMYGAIGDIKNGILGLKARILIYLNIHIQLRQSTYDAIRKYKGACVS